MEELHDLSPVLSDFSYSERHDLLQEIAQQAWRRLQRAHRQYAAYPGIEYPVDAERSFVSAVTALHIHQLLGRANP